MLDRFSSDHTLTYLPRYKIGKDEQVTNEEKISSRIRDSASSKRLHSALPIELRHLEKAPPLLRATMTSVDLTIGGPRFPQGNLSDFLSELGELPRDTEFTLLIPLHLTWTADSFLVTLRDYPLPLIEVAEGPASWSLTTNLVVAEEDGPDTSVDWFPCNIPPPGPPAARALELSIPKTIMPVKTYACPEIRIQTPHITDFCWGVSYTPAIQDVMRVLDTLSSAPRDPSPPVGFWDKLRLILHWRVRAHFNGEVRMHVKGALFELYLL